MERNVLACEHNRLSIYNYTHISIIIISEFDSSLLFVTEIFHLNRNFVRLFAYFSKGVPLLSQSFTFLFLPSLENGRLKKLTTKIVLDCKNLNSKSI